MREYEVLINGLPHTVQLSDVDARARGLKVVEKAALPPPQNKARQPANKKG